MNSAVCYGIVKIFGAFFFFWCLIFARSACIIFFFLLLIWQVYIYFKDVLSVMLIFCLPFKKKGDLAMENLMKSKYVRA